MACQLLARGHCVVSAMHANSLPKPAWPASSQECQFHLPVPSTPSPYPLDTQFFFPTFLHLFNDLYGNNKHTDELCL